MSEQELIEHLKKEVKRVKIQRNEIEQELFKVQKHNRVLSFENKELRSNLKKKLMEQLDIEQVKHDIINRYERMLSDEQLHLTLICAFHSEASKVFQETSVAVIDILIDAIAKLKQI